MDECNDVAQQFVATYLNQINFLASWGIAALGGILATAFGIVLHNQSKPDKYIEVSFWPLWFSVGLLAVSLFSSYLALNGLTQAIPDICTHNFSDADSSLSENSEIYRGSVAAIQIQYITFVLAIVSVIVLIVINRRIMNRRRQSTSGESD